MEKILSDFGIDWRLFAAQIVNFLVLLFILKKLLYKPILNLLDERKKRIEESLANAEKIQKELEETEINREKVINEAIEESKKIIAEATVSANQIVADAHAKAKADMDKMMEEGRQMIAGERDKMTREVKGEVAGMIELSLEKVLGKALDSKSHQKLVDEAVKTIKS
jgi:F-type H+-transporting ATPase subunit b